jgi:hypothetical protein
MIFCCYCVSSAVGTRIAHNSNKRDEAKQKLADLFRPPHDLLFNGTFQEVCNLSGPAPLCPLLF